MPRKKLVILTGAGISAESGIKTFRDSNGLWEGHDIQEVASPIGFAKNPELVLDFYNQRRKQARGVQPNEGHYSLVELEKYFDLTIITQNVDSLHEKAGSSSVIHLHGELNKMRSTIDLSYIVEMEGSEINLGDLCPKGGQLRPHIVWFGESVPMFDIGVKIAQNADVLAVIGTSLVVYPANTLLAYAPKKCPIFLVDPKKPEENFGRKIEYFIEKATTGVPKLAKLLIDEFQG